MGVAVQRWGGGGQLLFLRAVASASDPPSTIRYALKPKWILFFSFKEILDFLVFLISYGAVVVIAAADTVLAPIVITDQPTTFEIVCVRAVAG